MATSSTPDTAGPLPPTLFNIYRTYKRETSIVIGWLVSFDKAAEPSSLLSAENDEESALQDLTVRQIADRARKAASMGKRPSHSIETAFKRVITNRSKLTKHYETLSSATQGVRDSTERHKVFNETLAEAYALLFPRLVRSKNESKNAPEQSPDRPATSCTNTFEALAGLIELEENFDISASEFWGDDVATTNIKRSSIAEDPIENIIATQAYTAELDAILETIKSIWRSFAAGDMPLTVAGWLTNLAQLFARMLSPPKTFGHQQALFCRFSELGGLREGLTLDDLVSDDFAEFTHGCGLGWPLHLLTSFLETNELPQSSEKECRPFKSFFRNASEEHEAKLSFAHSVIGLVSRDKGELSEERLAKETDICANRYDHDILLLASMVKSVSRSSAFERYQPIPLPDELRGRGRTILNAQIQHPFVIPLLADLKKKVVDISTVVATHLLLESGRNFLHECEKIGKYPPNCRIILLRRVNDMISAIAHLFPTGVPDINVAFHPKTVEFILLLDLNLKFFRSDKTFDVYSQSPWVTGSYMSGLSDLSLFVGLEILNDGDCFGAVMHMYNMLQQVDAGCPKIPILEQLRTLFKSVVFAGKKEPRRNFADIFELFCGGAKIHKDKSFRLLGQARPKEHRHVHKEDSKISLKKMPLSARESFYNIYLFHASFWVQLTGEPKMAQKSFSHKTYDDVFATFPPSDLLRRAKEVLRPEYEGTFPMARVNYFAVFGLCQEILLAIVTRFKELGSAAWPIGFEDIDSPGLSHIENISIECALKCVRITMRLLDGMHYGYNMVRKKGQVGYNKQWKDAIEKVPPIVIMRDTIAKVCEGRNLEDFLWKNV